MRKGNEYALVTAARNEERHIELTIESVVAQIILPVKWVIVSDGSTDRTDDIVKGYADRHDFIQYERKLEDRSQAGFESKVYALRVGHSKLEETDYSYVGHLDADVSFDQTYYERLIAKFQQNSRLGIAGGYIYEERDGQFQIRRTNTVRSVAGAVQLFRKECYQQIGGVDPVRVGGEDSIAETKARMRGWEVEAFPELLVFHHRSSLSKRGAVRDVIRQGKMDYCVGCHPLFEVAKCFRRLKDEPFPLHPLLRMAGFWWSYLSRRRRPVAKEVVAFLRNEQIERLKAFFKMSNH